MEDFITILISSLIAINCSILGCFLVLRRMSMLVDAISHTVLPGIILAFLLWHTRDTFVMVVGAGIFGILTSIFIEFLQKKVSFTSDVSTGITYTFLFAVGIILVSAFTQKIDLDQECVLYGDILHVTLDVLVVKGIDIGPKTLWILLFLLGSSLLFVIVYFRSLLIITFDEVFAISIGIPVTLFNYAFTSFVSFGTVTAFESVGAILVVAFFVIPPSIGWLISKNLKSMILISCVVGIISSTLGFFLASMFNSSLSGMIVVVLGLIFFLVFALRKKLSMLMQSV